MKEKAVLSYERSTKIHRRNFMRIPRFLLGMGVEMLGWIVTDYRKKYCLYFQQSPF